MRYNNNGRYNKKLLKETLLDFCEITNRKYDKELLYSKEFIHYVLYLCEGLSTNKTGGAGEFTKINKEIFENGNYTQHTADCLFKTFSYIMRELCYTNKKKWRVA